MNKKELAEQIAKKHLGILWNELGEGAKGLITAAIIEAMSLTDSEPEFIKGKPLDGDMAEILNKTYSRLFSKEPIRLNESPTNKEDVASDRVEAMGVQPGMSECDTNKDFLPNCNFGYSYHNIKTENDDVTYFLRNLAWGKNDEFKYALKQLVLRLRKIEELLNNVQNVQVSDTTDDAQRYSAD